jgi:hypothetical protein
MRAYCLAAAILMMLSSISLLAVETLTSLKAKADAAHGGEQAKLCLEYARLQLETPTACSPMGRSTRRKPRSGSG